MPGGSDGKVRRKRQLGRFKRQVRVNIKMDLREIEWDGMN
jgi:hypothetical protein